MPKDKGVPKMPNHPEMPETEKKGKGRPKNIQSPELMWNLFTEYKTWAKANPILVHDFVGKDGDSVERRRERPLTMEGFELYCFDQAIITDMGDYFSNKENRYKDFTAICSRIRKAIRNDQITGGMAGIYNPSITQRLNGLKENVEETGSKEVTVRVKYENKQNQSNE